MFVGPIYALFDNHYWMCYGDYGSFTFDCTHKPRVTNLAYNSPSYVYEKLDVVDNLHRKVFSGNTAAKNIIRCITSSTGYEELNELQQERVLDYIRGKYWDLDEDLQEFEEELDEMKSIYTCAHDQWDLISRVREMDQDNRFLGWEVYDLCTAGDVVPTKFFIILYCLSIVANEYENKEQELVL